MRIRDLVQAAHLPEDGVYYLHRWRHPTMRLLLTLFTLSLVFVACETQPVVVDTPDAQFAKGGKPDKPPKPANGELIIFAGDLEGEEIVVGCCPNAGPFPEYTMTLSETFPPGMSGTHEGNIFMNTWGPKGSDSGDYIVQFWWGEEAVPDYFVEIKGGEKEYNRRTKVLTVDFDEENIVEMNINGEAFSPEGLGFVLTRAPSG